MVVLLSAPVGGVEKSCGATIETSGNDLSTEAGTHPEWTAGRIEGAVQLRLAFRLPSIIFDGQSWVWYNRNSDLGTRHAVWEATMASTKLLKKLRMQPGQRALIFNAPGGYLDELGPLPEGVEPAQEPEGNLDFVRVFAKDLAELEKLAPLAAEAVKHDGLLWVSYPKKSSKVESDLSRDVVWKAVAKTGLRPVRQVSVNDVWLALRFRPPEKVGK